MEDEHEFVEFEIDEDDPVDALLLGNHNEFENVEIEIPDDINLDDLKEISEDNVMILDSLPRITFCNEASVALVVEHGVSQRRTLVCPHCSKSYTRISFFEKLVRTCSSKLIFFFFKLAA